MEPFKNKINLASAKRISRALQRSGFELNEQKFLSHLNRDLNDLELKDRVRFLAKKINEILPSQTAEAYEICRQALKQSERDEIGLSQFDVWPLAELISIRGVDFFAEAMMTIKAITQVFTGEFAIRPFLHLRQQETLKQLELWSQDSCEHVRRLTSEGSRPLLPWGEKLRDFVDDPTLTLTILNQLINDPSIYVRKSVANHLNDHSKNHGDWVVAQLKIWQKQHQYSEQFQWILRHGTRTLIKKGHVGAFGLQGIKTTGIELVAAKILSPKISIGQSLHVKITVRNTTQKKQQVVFDHLLLFRGARDQWREKIFKGKKLTLEAGESFVIESRIPIKNVTVRRYYLGEQKWAPVINGVRHRAGFFLLQ